MPSLAVFSLEVAALQVHQFTQLWVTELIRSATVNIKSGQQRRHLFVTLETAKAALYFEFGEVSRSVCRHCSNVRMSKCPAPPSSP